MFTNNQDIKKRLKEYAKGYALIPNPSKSLWVDDNDFYVTVLEIQPWHGGGCFFNIHVAFLWYDYFAYHYTDASLGQGRVSCEGIPHGLITYDDPDNAEKVERLLLQGEAQIKAYRALKDIEVLIDRLENRRDLFYYQYPKDHLRCDEDLAFAYALHGDFEKTAAIFAYRRENSHHEGVVH